MKKKLTKKEIMKNYEGKSGIFGILPWVILIVFAPFIVINTASYFRGGELDSFIKALIFFIAMLILIEVSLIIDNVLQRRKDVDFYIKKDRVADKGKKKLDKKSSYVIVGSTGCLFESNSKSKQYKQLDVNDDAYFVYFGDTEEADAVYSAEKYLIADDLEPYLRKPEKQYFIF